MSHCKKILPTAAPSAVLKVTLTAMTAFPYESPEAVSCAVDCVWEDIFVMHPSQTYNGSREFTIQVLSNISTVTL